MCGDVAPSNYSEEVISKSEDEVTLDINESTKEELNNNYLKLSWHCTIHFFPSVGDLNKPLCALSQTGKGFFT
jgi:hypothetical protein